MRLLILITCCFFCSCAYLEGIIVGNPSLIDKPSGSENNSTGGQSKQAELNAGQSTESSQKPELPSESQDIEITALSQFGILERRLNQQKFIKAHKTEAKEVLKYERSGKKVVFTVSADGEVLIWDSKQSFEQAKTVTTIAPDFTGLALDSKKLYLAAAYPSLIEIHDLAQNKKIFSTTRINTRIGSLDFSPIEDSIMLAGADSVIYRWQYELEKKATTIAESEKVIERYMGHPSVVNIVRYHPFGRVFISSDWGGILYAWLLFSSDRYDGRYDENIFGGRFFSDDINRMRSSRKITTIIEQAEFSKDGQFFYLADEAGSIEIWQMRGLRLAYTHLLAHKGKIYDMCLSPSQEKIFTLGRDGKLRKWNIVSKPSKYPGFQDITLELSKEVDLPSGRKVECLTDEQVATVGIGSNGLQIVEINE